MTRTCRSGGRLVALGLAALVAALVSPVAAQSADPAGASAIASAGVDPVAASGLAMPLGAQVRLDPVSLPVDRNAFPPAILARMRSALERQAARGVAPGAPLPRP